MPRVDPQPLIAVADVEASSAWYRAILLAEDPHRVSGGHGAEYQRLLVDGRLVLQLHDLAEDHHHGPMGDPAQRLGNGVAVWFAVSDFDAAVDRIRETGAQVETDVHLNPNAGQREIWLRDPDGYRVVLAETQDSYA